ncbi:hypothetical protein Pst134EB_021591 [Puccinia striiformis f. sp. tritici]|nr:hypothetical protein Pst134EB_021591 [Puccinia striiformis f. sp. tritici]
MGKSAKFYKRPTRKEKMGISSNSNSLRAAIASNLDMEVDQDSIIKRKNLKSKVNKNSHKLPESDFKQIDYVDLYDRPDRRKSSLSNAKKK